MLINVPKKLVQCTISKVEQVAPPEKVLELARLLKQWLPEKKKPDDSDKNKKADEKNEPDNNGRPRRGGGSPTKRRKKEKAAEKLSERWERASPNAVQSRALLKQAAQLGELLSSVAETDDMRDKYRRVWTELTYLLKVATDQNPKPEEVATFQEKAKAWGNVYVECFGGTAVTAYVHLLVAHVHQYLAAYRSFGKFGNWAAEGIHSPLKRWLLNLSPRAGGRQSRGVAFWAMRRYVLAKKFSVFDKPTKRQPNQTQHDIRQRQRMQLLRAARKAARSSQTL